MAKTKKEYHGHPKFYEIIEEIKQLHSEKNKQYATKDNPLGNFTRVGQLASKLINPNIKNKALAVALLYMMKQVDGAIEMVAEAKKDTPDELKDKLRDIATYSMISEIIVEECK